MNLAKYISIFLFLFYQASLCFAGSENSINVSVAPDTTTQCHQLRADFSMTSNSTLGIMPAHCTNRPSRPSRFFWGNMEMNSEVTNKFDRILIPWRYSPHGAFQNGYFVEALVGMEKSELKSMAGSSANVTFVDTGVWLGYQWFWRSGVNISLAAGFAHLAKVGGDKTISPSESAGVRDYLDRQTSSNTHVGGGAFFGWAF